MDLHLSRVALIGVAAFALVASATGGAVADRLITSADIQDHTIKREDLATGSIGGRVVKNGSVTSADLEDQTVQADDLAAGSVGRRALANGSVTRSDLAPGLRKRLGSAGPAGPAGAPGVSGYEIVTQDVTGPGGTIAEASCPAGKKVLSGGWERVSGLVPGIGQNGPKPDGTGWTMEIQLGLPGNTTIRAYAICAAVSP